MHAAIGAKQIEERTLSQATQLKEGSRRDRRCQRRDPDGPKLSAGIVCIELGDWMAPDAVYALHEDHQIRASVTPYATQYLRFGSQHRHDSDEVDAAIEAVGVLAEQAPLLREPSVESRSGHGIDETFAGILRADSRSGRAGASS